MVQEKADGCGAADEVDLDFEGFLSAALQGSPPDISEQLRMGLTKRYDKPPVRELELCLGRSVPLEKARQLLFFPSDEDMALYPQLLATPPPDAPDSHPQRAVQVCALASLYLVHSKRWDRVQPLIQAGGLRPLVAALSHPNPYLASQAMSSLLALTDEELLFPWHDPPPAPDGRGPRQGPYAHVWRQMYEVCSGPLLGALLSHRRDPPAFPGASDMALRLLAFSLSWLRKHFTQDGRLSLSSSLLATLQQWSTDPRVSEDERQLASQLHKDFSRQGGVSCRRDAARVEATERGKCEPTAQVRVVSERTQVNSGPSADDEAELLRELGNEAYRRGDYTAAIAAYSAALDVPVPAQRLLTEAPRRAAYHANRAAAYMARAAAGALREGDCDMAGHLEGVDLGSEGALARHYEAAVMDCDLALDMQPSGPAAAKACLRKCRALGRLGRHEDAAAAARAGLGKCGGGGGEGGVSAELRVELEQVMRALGRRPGGEGRAGAGASGVVTVAAEGRAEAAVEGAGRVEAEAARGRDDEAAVAAAAVLPAAAAGVGTGPVNWNEMD
ncbi:hypothetical protein GPECTOR_26g581 [Gonium pectorale]|uniref:Uncharacterized protein n=1 Tax=Gonium pectorale TaxID=33097 RepID=A0A150GFR1_GONPE|nr:hypothetical protein GPECTOR_26g581 [Gonium pectorale]|eukprot:KXZ48678.1 hypothetical protein GPECTOR_26g581 [Gonium pectorale]